MFSCWIGVLIQVPFLPPLYLIAGASWNAVDYRGFQSSMYCRRYDVFFLILSVIPSRLSKTAFGRSQFRNETSVLATARIWWSLLYSWTESRLHSCIILKTHEGGTVLFRRKKSKQQKNENLIELIICRRGKNSDVGVHENWHKYNLKQQLTRNSLPMAKHKQGVNQEVRIKSIWDTRNRSEEKNQQQKWWSDQCWLKNDRERET